MANDQVKKLLEFANMQMAAEAFLISPVGRNKRSALRRMQAVNYCHFIIE